MWTRQGGLYLPKKNRMMMGIVGSRAGGAGPTIQNLYVNAGGASPTNKTLDVEWDQEISTSSNYTNGVTIEARAPSGTWTTITTYTAAKLTGADNDKIRYTMTGTVDTFQASHEVRYSYVESSGGLESTGGDPVADITDFATLTNSSSIDLLDGLDAFWNMDDVTDEVGSHDWTNNNTVTFISGKIGNSAELVDGSSQYLSLTDTAALNLGGDKTWTVGGWFRYDEDASDWAFSQWGAAGTRSWCFRLRPSNDHIEWMGSANGSSQYAITNASYTNTLGTWYCHIARRNAADNVTEFLLDDNSVGTSTLGGNDLYTSSEDIEVGGNAASALLDGGADAVFITNGRRWSDAECTDFYNGGSGKEYPFVPT